MGQAGGGQGSGSCPGAGGLVAAETRQVVAWPVDRPGSKPGDRKLARPVEVVQAQVVARRGEVAQAVVAWSLQRPGRWWPAERKLSRRRWWPGEGKLSRRRWPCRCRGQW